MPAILNNRNFIFILAITLGLVLPGPAEQIKVLMMPALAVAMALATINVPDSYFSNLRAIIGPSLIGIAMNYLVLGGLVLTMSELMISDPDIRTGFVLIAAVPPAVAVIPFTVLLNGNLSMSLSGAVASYIAGLITMPLALLIFTGRGFSDPVKLINIFLILIVIPLIVSRIILRFKLENRIAPVRGTITDWSFFIVLYSITGVNSDLIFSSPEILIRPCIICFSATFIIGGIIQAVGLLSGISRPDMVSMVLQGTMKNQGIAGGIALTLFDKNTALPSALYSIFMIIYFIWLNLKKKSVP